MAISDDVGCSRRPLDGDCYVSELQLTNDEEVVLRIARIFFHSFTTPDSHAWVPAFAEAEEAFGSDQGFIIAGRTLNVLKSIRRIRLSPFTFNSPSCPGCSKIATEQERRLMLALALVRLGDNERAEGELVMLCENREPSSALGAIRNLSSALATPNLPRTSRQHHTHGLLQ